MQIFILKNANFSLKKKKSRFRTLLILRHMLYYVLLRQRLPLLLPQWCILQDGIKKLSFVQAEPDKGGSVMPRTISEKARRIAPSATLAMDAKAKALKAQGVSVVSFAAGEPDFDTPLPIRNAMKDAMDQNMTRYTPVGGTAELKEAIIHRFEEDHGLHYDPQEIIVSTARSIRSIPCSKPFSTPATRSSSPRPTGSATRKWCAWQEERPFLSK